MPAQTIARTPAQTDAAAIALARSLAQAKPRKEFSTPAWKLR